MPTSQSTVIDRAEVRSAAEVLTAARASRRAADRAEADLLVLAVEWAVCHPAEGIHEPASVVLRGFGQTDLALAGPGAPTVGEYAVPELAAVLGMSPGAGRSYLGEALELRYRLPRLWARVMSGDLVAWKARRVAAETIRLSEVAAAYVDRQVAGFADHVGPAQLDRLVNEAIGRHMPEEVARLADASWDKRHVTVHDQLVSFTGTMRLDAELDIADALDLDTVLSSLAAHRADLGSTESLDVRRSQALGDLSRGQAALPLDLADAADGAAEGLSAPQRGRQPRQVVLHVHLADAALSGLDPVARLERGDSLVSIEQVRSWCGRADTTISIRPVLDPQACDGVDPGRDSGDVPDRLRDVLAVRDRTCVFPWCTRPARACDADHVVPHSRGGRTCLCNLAPLCRTHHRVKTHALWRYTVLDPGSYLWSSPHGYQFLRDPTGTRNVTDTG